jgi:predicted RNase H-like HicB family nuclease
MQGVLQLKLFGMMKREDGWYIAHCPPLDITTQGRTQAEPRRNLSEATELFVISCLERGSLDQALRELGFTKIEKTIASRPEGAFPLMVPIPLRFQKNAPCHA